MPKRKKLVLKDNVVEHYAFRSSENCIKFDALNELIGGIYDCHPCTYLNDVLAIYNKFTKLSDNLIAGAKGYRKVETCHHDTYADENKKYTIHIFVQPRTHDERRRLWFHAGILLNFPSKVGYCRIFCFPCK